MVQRRKNRMSSKKLSRLTWRIATMLNQPKVRKRTEIRKESEKCVKFVDKYSKVFRLTCMSMTFFRNLNAIFAIRSSVTKRMSSAIWKSTQIKGKIFDIRPCLWYDSLTGSIIKGCTPSQSNFCCFLVQQRLSMSPVSLQNTVSYIISASLANAHKRGKSPNSSPLLNFQPIIMFRSYSVTTSVPYVKSYSHVKWHWTDTN